MDMKAEIEKFEGMAFTMFSVHFGYCIGLWDLIEDSAIALSPAIGEQTLVLTEQIVGHEIKGATPIEFLTELGNVSIDKFGFGSEFKITVTDNSISVLFLNSNVAQQYSALQKQGAEKIFADPYLCSGIAGLAKMGVKVRGEVKVFTEEKSHEVIFYPYL
jgi:hypothetical protein